jgi:hypothetical protein
MATKTPPKRQTGPTYAAERVAVTEELFTQKMADKSITVREALSYIADTALASTRPTKADKDNFNRTVNLIGQLAEEGVDVDAPYFQVYTTKEFNTALDPIESKAGVNRWGPWIWFETRLETNSKLLETPINVQQLGGTGGIARVKYKLAGVQSRGGDPMRGTIFSEDLDKIYDEALNVESYEVFDNGVGTKKEVLVDSDARAYLYYEKYTGQRLESNIGPDGIKISDVTFGQDDNGNLIAEIAGKQTGNKTRPEVTYTGEFAEFLKAHHDKQVANLKPGEVTSETNLFRVSKTKVNKLWTDRIQPLLEERFPDQLPAKKGGTHSVIRKILARQLLREFRVDRGAVKSWMGHAGVGIDDAGDILEEHYTGAVPDERVGPLSNLLIHKNAKNMGADTVNALFIMNRLDVPRMTSPDESTRVIYKTPEKVDNLVTGNITNFVREPSAQELSTIDTLSRKTQLQTEIENEELQKRLEDIKTERLTAKVDNSPEAIQRAKDNVRAKQELRDAAAEEAALIKKEKAAAEAVSELPPETMPTGLADKLKKIGIATGTVAATVASTAAKSAPVVSAAFIPERVEELQTRYDMSQEEATAMAGVEEVTPVGVAMAAKEVTEDVGMAAAGEVISAAEEGLESQYGTRGPLTDESLEDIVTRLVTGGRDISGFMK